MKNSLYKIYWLLKNLRRLRPVSFDFQETAGQKHPKLCVIYVDYASLSDRRIKNIKNNEFICGKENIKILHDLACELSADFQCFVSRDSTDDRVSYENLYQTHYVENMGTDISTLCQMKNFISDYDIVCICNSSAPLESVTNYAKQTLSHALELSLKTRHFVVGLHGNSFSSPSLKITRGGYPHVVTSFFICRVRDLLKMFDADSDVHHETACKVWGDKYFAIRNFELQLSTSVLASGGTLSICGPHEFELTHLDGSWPKQDSRLLISNRISTKHPTQ